MPTYVYSKEKFIEWLQKEVTEDQAIVFSNELTGNLTISARSGLKLHHVFAHDVFKDEGVGHIAFGKSLPLCLIIANKERLSESSLKLLAPNKK